MGARELQRMTFEEYRALEASSDEPFEYVNGEAWAVSSPSPAHNVVVGNVFVALRNALRGKPCLPYPERQKISTPATGSYHYADASVVCGQPQLDAKDAHAMVNPTLLVEVLSPSTGDYDRGGKLRHYRTLESLREYVVVDLEERLVEHHARLDTGQWLMTELREGGLELASVGVTIPLAELWLDVERLADA